MAIGVDIGGQSSQNAVAEGNMSADNIARQSQDPLSGDYQENMPGTSTPYGEP